LLSFLIGNYSNICDSITLIYIVRLCIFQISHRPHILECKHSVSFGSWRAHLILWFIVNILLSVLNVETGTKNIRHQEYVMDTAMEIVKGALGKHECLPWLYSAEITMSLVVASN